MTIAVCVPAGTVENDGNVGYVATVALDGGDPGGG